MKQWVLLGFLLMGLFACAGGPPFGKRLTPEEALERRVTAYWEAKQKKDWAAVRSFVDPEIREDVADVLDRHEKGSAATEIVSWKVQRIDVDGEEALVVTGVSTRLTHPLLGGKPIQLDQVFEDRWVKRGKHWYVVVLKPNLGEALEILRKKRQGD